jgi:ribosomal protein L34
MYTNPSAQFDPTIDEVNALKQIELGGPLPLATALKKHLPPRLTQHGFLARGSEGSYVITQQGRELIRRRDA